MPQYEDRRAAASPPVVCVQGLGFVGAAMSVTQM